MSRKTPPSLRRILDRQQDALRETAGVPAIEGRMPGMIVSRSSAHGVYVGLEVCEMVPGHVSIVKLRRGNEMIGVLLEDIHLLQLWREADPDVTDEIAVRYVGLRTTSRGIHFHAWCMAVAGSAVDLDGGALPEDPEAAVSAVSLEALDGDTNNTHSND